MNPAIFAGIAVALLASSSGNKQTPKPPISAGAVVAALIWTIVFPAFVLELGLLFEAIGRGAWAEAGTALVFTGLTAVVLFPWPIARWLLIPAGQVELAWAVTRLSFWVWRRDVRGGAVVAASWAAVRRTERVAPATIDPDRVAWIERRRDSKPAKGSRWVLGGAGIVATGLLAEAQGDRASARRLLSSTLELAQPTRPNRAVTLACEWLCAEAMERGAWREVECLARTAPVRTRRLRWFGAVAARLTGIAPVPSDARLVWLWLCAPGRLLHRELLGRARACAVVVEQRVARGRDTDRETPESSSDDPFVRALTLHSVTLARPSAQLDRDDLVRLGRAWDRALGDPALERRLLERGLALGTHEHASGLDQLGERVRDDLLALVRAAGLELGPLVDCSEQLARAARQLQAGLLDELEIAAGALETRVRARRELPTSDEWQTFLALRGQHAAAVAIGGLELRRLAFADVHTPVCALAVWLWNDRNERAIGNAMFQWLLSEAIIVDDAEAIRLQERNVDCGV